MKISVMDAGNYFRGLLLLMRKDRKVSQEETDLMKRIGKALGFAEGFCVNAICEILENRFIEDAPPEFSSKELAARFIRDGLALAFSDNEYDPSEEQWLRATAERNGIDPELFAREQEEAAGRRALPGRLEVDDMTVSHS